jgi:hypothetical protein
MYGHQGCPFGTYKGLAMVFGRVGMDIGLAGKGLIHGMESWEAGLIDVGF